MGKAPTQSQKMLIELMLMSSVQSDTVISFTLFSRQTISVKFIDIDFSVLASEEKIILEGEKIGTDFIKSVGIQINDKEPQDFDIENMMIFSKEDQQLDEESLFLDTRKHDRFELASLCNHS